MPKSQVHLVSNWAFLLHGPVHFLLDMINISAPKKGEGQRFWKFVHAALKKCIQSLDLYNKALRILAYMWAFIKGICEYIHLASK